MQTSHLIRISESFYAFMAEIFKVLGAENITKLGAEFYIIHTNSPEKITDSSVSLFIRWHIPLEHSWPCNPEMMSGFVEKAAQALYYKFESRNPQTLLVGRLDSSSFKPYFKSLASNLRGRTLQVFDFPDGGLEEAEDQDPDVETLFCLVGKEGLYAGSCTPKHAGGYYPGGTKFISQNLAETISRAGAKIVEGLHYLSLYHPLPSTGAHWLELGASPGGMTSELLNRGYRVTAVDRAALSPRLSGHKDLEFIRSDVKNFTPSKDTKYDAILCDMNGTTLSAFAQVVRLAPFAQPGAVIIFTLKTLGIEGLIEISTLKEDILALAKKNGLIFLASNHLTYNRMEFTLFFKNAG